MHALIVDDSTTVRMIMKVHLKNLGFQVTEAVNGRDGLEQLKKMERTDLVLVDWNMPEMDGISFIRAVRKERDRASLPMMMVTTNTDISHVAQALDAGANEYIMKPFTGEMIREKLELLGFLAA